MRLLQIFDGNVTKAHAALFRGPGPTPDDLVRRLPRRRRGQARFR